jgi:hypothetical protein
VLQAWLDDCGKDGVSPVFVLAGYISSVDLWRDFSDSWNMLLREPPPLKWIKGYEAFGLREEFKGWSIFDRDSRLLQFVPLVKQFSNTEIAFVIEYNPFAMTIESAQDSPFYTPQALAFYLALTSILSFVQGILKGTDTIDIVFDRDVVGRRFAEMAYKELFTRAPDLAALLARREPRFEDDEHFMPLQAADLLAHCVRAYNDPDPKYERVTKSPVFSALRAMNVAYIPITKGQMEYWRDRIEKGISRQSVTVAHKW